MFIHTSRPKSPLHRLGVLMVLAVLALSASPVWAAAPAAAAGPIDLNSADAATLQTLPGVGPATAAQIIAARPFASVDDLAKIKGIGPVKLAALRDKVTVKGAKPAAPPPAMPSFADKPKTSPASAPALPSPPPAVAVPSAKPSPTSSGFSKGVAQAALAKVNINTASQADLEKLPGVGPVKAKAIVAGRPYSKVEDVMKVPGIKEGVFAKIKNGITVD